MRRYIYCEHCHTIEEVVEKNRWFRSPVVLSKCGKTRVTDESQYVKLKCKDESCKGVLEILNDKVICSICRMEHSPEDISGMMAMQLQENQESLDIKWPVNNMMKETRLAHVHSRGKKIPDGSTLSLYPNQAVYYRAGGKSHLYIFDTDGVSTFPIFPKDGMENDEQRRNALYDRNRDPLCEQSSPYRLDTDITFFNATKFERYYNSKQATLDPVPGSGYHFNLKAIKFGFQLFMPDDIQSNPQKKQFFRRNLDSLWNLAGAGEMDGENDYERLEKDLVETIEEKLRNYLNQLLREKLREWSPGMNAIVELYDVIDNDEFKQNVVDMVNTDMAKSRYSMYQVTGITFDPTKGFVQEIPITEENAEESFFSCPQCNQIIPEVRDNDRILGPRCPHCRALIHYCKTCKKYFYAGTDEDYTVVCSDCGSTLRNTRWY